MPLYLCGFVVLGAAFQKKLSVGAVVMGWGLAEVAVMINTVAICKFTQLSTYQNAIRLILVLDVDAYCNDCFPRHKVRKNDFLLSLFKAHSRPNNSRTVSLSLQKIQGEISALINLARTLGGFSVAYFQVPWATKHGALQTFGVEAA